MAIAKVKAATLVETLTAATILSLVAGLGIMIFLRLSTPASNGAVLLEGQVQTYTMAQTDFFCEQEEENQTSQSNRLLFESSWNNRSAELIQQTITAEDNEGRIIYTRKRLYYAR